MCMINLGLFNLGALRKSSTGWRAAVHKEHIDNEDECEQNRPGDCFVKVVGRSGHALTFDSGCRACV